MAKSWINHACMAINHGFSFSLKGAGSNKNPPRFPPHFPRGRPLGGVKERVQIDELENVEFDSVET